MIVRTLIKAIFLIATMICILNIAGFCQMQTSSASYRITHTSNTRFIQSCNFIHTRDNATIMVGKWGTSEDASDLLIMKLNERGEVVWSKKVVVGRMLREYELTEMSDGSIVFAGNSFYNSAPINSDIVVIKFTCKGEIVWSKNLSMNASVNKRYMTLYSIKQGKNNDAIISFYGNETNSQYAVICRVNNSGDLVWSKTFYGIDAQTNLLPISFFADDKIVVFGFKYLYSNYFIYNKSIFVMKLNYDNGAVEYTKGYDYSEFFTNATVLVAHPKIHFYAEQLTNGNFALFGIFSNSDGNTASFYKILVDKNLNVSKTMTFSVPVKFAFQWSKIRVLPNGQTHILCTDDNYNMIYWYSVDSIQNKIREKKLSYPSYVDLYYMVAQSGTNRSTYMVSNGSSIEVVQAEDGAAISSQCLGSDTSITKQVNWQVSSGSTQWKSVKDSEATITPIQFVSSVATFTSKYICEPVKTQDPVNNRLKIMGDDTVCFPPRSSHIYIARMVNAGTPVQWTIDQNQKASLSVLNDSMVSVSFKDTSSPESLILYAYTGSCEVFKDSIAIHVFPENNKLAGNYNSCDLPLKLHPGNWFKNYLWQDGSRDSVYVIKNIGKYFVKLQTYCGDYIQDSLEVSAAEIGMAKNLVICKNHSVTITAPPGFAKYEWTPNYNLILLSTNSVRVYPESNSFYMLKTTTLQGCELNDTIFVKVNEHGTIDLGSDTALCQNEVLTLQGGTGFSSYTWNTGELTQNIIVKSPGTFSVTAVNANGCTAKDTIIIKGKECKNLIYIPTAFTPNQDGKNDLFKSNITGPIEEYQLVIFNRFGEIVFKTKNPNDGWSGKYKGIQQESNVFVWICTYKFLNESLKIIKGTVTLIK